MLPQAALPRQAFVGRSLPTKLTSADAPGAARMDRPGDLLKIEVGREGEGRPLRQPLSTLFHSPALRLRGPRSSPTQPAEKHRSPHTRRSVTCSCCCADFPGALGSLAVVMVSGLGRSPARGRRGLTVSVEPPRTTPPVQPAGSTGV